MCECLIPRLHNCEPLLTTLSPSLQTTVKEQLLERLNNYLQMDDAADDRLETQQKAAEKKDRAMVSNFDVAFQDGQLFYLMVKKCRPDCLPDDPSTMSVVSCLLTAPP